MNELGRRETRVLDVNRRTGDPKFSCNLVNRDILQYDHLMGKENPKVGSDKDNEFVAVEHFELSAIHLPGGLFP